MENPLHIKLKLSFILERAEFTNKN